MKKVVFVLLAFILIFSLIEQVLALNNSYNNIVSKDISL